MEKTRYFKPYKDPLSLEKFNYKTMNKVKDLMWIEREKVFEEIKSKVPRAEKNKSIQNIGTNNIPQQIPYQLNNIDNNLDNNMQNDSNINNKEQKENNYGNNNKNINNNISIMSIEYENKIREDLQLNNWKYLGLIYCLKSIFLYIFYFIFHFLF